LQRLVVRTTQIEGTCLSLTLEQQRYLKRVLRLRTGDRFLALNGAGAVWVATLGATGDQADLSLAPKDIAGTIPAHRAGITLAASLPKQGFDEVVRQATELGVERIVPILSDRALLRPSPNKLARWQRIAAEAAEQSERLTVPEVSQPQTWKTWLAVAPNHQRFLCVARQAVPTLWSVCISVSPTVVAIGPEGGWTEAEVEAAIAAGYQPVTLGPAILRAVTAAVAALSILQARFEFVNMRTYSEESS
jgi:16S rRNA (uracil1498-N3)-methyltransferase